MFKPIALTAALIVTGTAFGLPASAIAGLDEHPRLQQLDMNHDGQLGPRERERARYLHNRIDVNDDGRISPRERAYARELKARADFNGDGCIGPRERHAAHHILNRVDRRH